MSRFTTACPSSVPSGWRSPRRVGTAPRSTSCSQPPRSRTSRIWAIKTARRVAKTMLTLPRAKFAEFRRNRSGMAATEMAFIAPIMILLALGGVDTTRYVIATEQIDKVASTIGQMLTETQPTIPGGRTAAVTYVDLQFFHDSAMVIFPDVLSDAANQGVSWTKDIEISMSSIQFTASPSTCTTNCTYTAQ